MQSNNSFEFIKFESGSSSRSHDANPSFCHIVQLVTKRGKTKKKNKKTKNKKQKTLICGAGGIVH
jgi:hypothetical protein